MSARYLVEIWDRTHTTRSLILEPSAIRRRRVIGGEETLSLDLSLPAEHSGLVRGAVVRLVREGDATDLTLWRVARRTRSQAEDGALTYHLEADALWSDLRHGRVRQVQSDGSALFAFGLLGIAPEAWIRDVILPGYDGEAVAFALGVVEMATPVDLTFDHPTSPLEALRMLEQVAGGEVAFRPSLDGRTYHVDILERIGQAGGGATLSYGRNLRGLELVEDEVDIATRLYAQGGGLLTLADAEWEITGVAGSAAARVLSFRKSPVFEDRAFEGLYFRVGSASYPITASEVEGGTITVSEGANPALAPGARGVLTTDLAGTRLAYLESPSAVGAYGVRTGELPDATDVPDASNLLSNGDFVDWTGSLPTHWTPIGAAAVSRDETPLYGQHGGTAARVVAATAGEGILSDAFTIPSSDRRPYLGMMAGLTVISGQIRLELRHSNGLIYPITQQAGSKGVGVYISPSAGPVHDEPLPAGTARMAIVAHGDAAEWYQDVAMISPQIGSDVPAFVRDQGAWLLWDRAVDELYTRSVERREYRVSVVDLYRVDPERFRFDRLDLGDDVRVQHPEFGSEVLRVVELDEDLLRAEAIRVSVAADAWSRPMTGDDVFRPVYRQRRPGSGTTEPNTSVPRSAYGLDNFREIEASGPGKRRWGWTSHGVRVESIWWAARAYTMPFDLADAWDAVARAVEPLPEGQNWVEVDVPADDENVLLQVEPRLADLTVYGGADVVERVQVYPVPSHLELAFSARIVDGKVDLSVSLTSAPGSMPYPATVEVYEGDPLTGTLLTTIAASADGRWTKAEDAALGGRSLPAEGKKVWTAVATDRTGTTYVREAVVNAPRLPYFDAVRSVLSSDLLSVAIYGVVVDPAGLGGTLEYWLPTAPDAPPDPSGAPTGSKVITAAELPYSFGPTQIPALGGIVTAGSSLTVVLRFIATDGRSTGKVPFPVAGSMQFLVDDLGKLRAESVHNGLVLAQQFRPYYLGTGAPTGTPTDYGTDRYFDTAALQPYKWSGSAWVVDAATPSVAFAPILRAGVVSATVLAADAAILTLVGAYRVKATNVDIGKLALIATDAGAIVKGSFVNAAGTAGLDLDATGAGRVLWAGGVAGSEKLKILADGSAFFTGIVRIDSSTDFAPGYNPTGKITSFYQGSAPTATAVGDIWINTADGNHPYRWSGSAWVSTRDSAAGSTAGLSASIYSATTPTTRTSGAALVQGDQWFKTDEGNKPHIWSGSAWVAAYTSIDGGNIKTGSIRSIVYTPGVAGWIIGTDGTVELNNATVRGTIYATAGEFVNVTVQGELRAGTVFVDGGKSLNLVRGMQRGTATHDQDVVFDSPFATGTVPVVIFGAGGLTKDGYVQQLRATGVTATGFKASLRLVSITGTPSPKSATFSGSTATKSEVSEAHDKTYTVNYSVSVNGNFGSASWVTIGFYANGSLCSTRDYSNPDPTGVPASYPGQSETLNVAGMGAGSTFTVQVIASGGFGGSVSPTNVEWVEMATSETTATPDGVSVPWVAFGGA